MPGGRVPGNHVKRKGERGRNRKVELVVVVVEKKRFRARRSVHRPLERSRGPGGLISGRC